jgi:hypothetical protein
MGAFIQDWTDRGILITAEGVLPSREGRRGGHRDRWAVHRGQGGRRWLGLINAKDRVQVVERAKRYAELLDEVEVRQVVSFDEPPDPACAPVQRQPSPGSRTIETEPSGCRWTFGSSRREEQVVGVAPGPVLAGLEGLDDRVPGGPPVPGGVPVG